MATGLVVPWVGAGGAPVGEPGQPSGLRGAGHDDGRNDKLLFFAADGVRQDAVERYADQGVVPGFRKLCATARARPATAC